MNDWSCPIFDEVKCAIFFQLKQTEFVLPPVVLKEHVVFEIEKKNDAGKKNQDLRKL
jgi:hypothetical protein